MNCPTCNADLPEKSTWCYICEEYLSDMGSTTDTTPEARERKARENIGDRRTEAEIQTEATRALDLLGYHVHDLSQGRATRQPCGIPDLYIQGHGVTAWLEMKKPGGKVSTHQAGFIERELTNGGNVLVAYSATEAVEYMESLRRRRDAA